MGVQVHVGQKIHQLIHLKTVKVSFFLVVLLLLPAGIVSANVYDDRAKVDQKIKEQKQALDHVHKKITTLEDQLSALEDSISDIAVRVSENQNQIVSVEQQIQEKEAQLAEKQIQIGMLMRSSYIQGDVSTLEMLASSKNLSDYIDQ